MKSAILKSAIWNLQFGIWNLEFGIWNLEFLDSSIGGSA
jgi:hypothetical protein